MSSKDKLIEFLKSANIEYTILSYTGFDCIQTYYVEYTFKITGEYMYSHGVY